MRNKFFFFGDYQRTIDNLGYVVRATMPTMAMRNGDFSAVANGIYDPLTGAVNGTGRTAFANNQIPQDRISPIARRLIAMIPEPNIAGAPLGQNNYQKAQVREKTTDAFDTKVNYSLNEKNQLSYRLSFLRPVVFDPGPYGEFGGPANDGFAGTGTNKSISTAGNWTRVFSTTMVMDVRGGVNYYHNIAISQGQGLTTSTDIGIPGANIDEFTSGLSRFTIGGYTAPVLGFSPSLPWDRSETTWNVATTVTKLLRSHTVKLGGEWRHNRDMLLQTQDAGGSRGQFNFNASGTGLPTDAASLSGVANSFASFLLDWPNGVTRDLKVIDEPGTQHSAVFLFMQDKWQARPNLTIDLGLRWEYYTPLTGLEGAGSLSNYDPATNTLRVVRLRHTNESVNVKSTFSNFNPRTGVSWRLNEETVLRAGYGASTIPFPDNRYAFNYPVKQNYSGSAANGFQAAGSMATGFPAPSLVDIPQDGIIPVSGSLLNSTYDVIPAGLREGTLHSWNVAVQRQLPFHLTADIAYVGNRGVESRHGRRRATPASSTVPATSAGRSSRLQPHRHDPYPQQREQVRVQRAADEGRPPLLERPADHELVHAEPVDGSRQREHQHRHADRLRSELGAVELRSHAQLRADGDLRAAVGAGQALDERQPARQDRRRLAVERPLHRAVRLCR